MIATADVLAWVVGPGPFHLTDRNFAKHYSIAFWSLRRLLESLKGAGVVLLVTRHPEEGVPKDELHCTWSVFPVGGCVLTLDEVLARAKERGFDLDEDLPGEIECANCGAPMKLREWVGERKIWSFEQKPDHVQLLRRLGRQPLAVDNFCGDCGKPNETDPQSRT